MKKLILKILLSKEEKQFISSALYTAEQTYKDRYNDISSESYKSEILKNNIPKLVNIREMFDSLK